MTATTTHLSGRAQYEHSKAQAQTAEEAEAQMKKSFPLWQILAVLLPMMVIGLVGYGGMHVRVQANEDAVKEQKTVQTEQGQAIARVDERTKLMLEMLRRIAENR